MVPSVATLDVRLWRGTALAAGLTIKGLPAYAFIDQQNAAKTPERPRPRCRFAKPIFPYTLFQQIDPDYLSAIADAFNAPLTLPIDRDLLDHELVRKCLLPPERAPFLPPKARNAREGSWRSIRWQFQIYDSEVAPLVELPPIADLGLTFPDGLTAVCEVLTKDFNVDFLPPPPADPPPCSPKPRPTPRRSPIPRSAIASSRPSPPSPTRATPKPKTRA